MNELKTGVVSLLVCLAFFAQPCRALAQDGFYVAMDPGFAAAPGLEVAATNNDWPTRCDLITNPAQAETDGACDETPPPTFWANDVDGGRGTMTALASGYRWGRVRIEGEYSHRTATHNDLSFTRIGDDPELTTKTDQEIETADGGVDDVLAHGLFANAYYDFAAGSRVVPYIGVGAGAARLSLDYFSRWKRNDNPDEIDTFTDPILRARLSGTTSIGRTKLSDTVLGYQAIAGIDYQVSALFSLGVKLRWTRFGEVEDDDEWLQLRSHESDVGRDFRVRYTVSTSDIAALGISLSMKYSFRSE